MDEAKPSQESSDSLDAMTGSEPSLQENMHGQLANASTHKASSNPETLHEASQLGKRLLQARTQQKLSQEQVVQQIKIPLKWLDAIEACRWSEFTNAAYIRSYLRHYAKLLEMNIEADINVLFPALRASEVVQPLAKMSRININNSRSKPFKTWLKLFLVLLLVALVFAVYRFGAPDVGFANLSEPGQEAVPLNHPLILPGQGDASTPSSATSSTPSDALGANLPINIVPLQQALEVNSASPSTNLLPQLEGQSAPPSSEIAANEHSLVINARASSWVQVKDLKGKELVTRTVKAGERFIFTVNKPFSLVVGNAESVDAHYGNQALNLKRNLSENGNSRLLIR